MHRIRCCATRRGARFEVKPSKWKDAVALAYRLIASVEHKPCPERKQPALV